MSLSNDSTNPPVIPVTDELLIYHNGFCPSAIPRKINRTYRVTFYNFETLHCETEVFQSTRQIGRVMSDLHRQIVRRYRIRASICRVVLLLGGAS